MKKNKNFNNVFSRDTLPKKITTNESGVVNLDLHSGGGTHWVCYRNAPDSKYVEYYDSYGFVPPKSVVKYLNTSDKPILYNSSEIQSSKSIMCGYYCCQYIKDRDAGKSMYDAIHKFDVEPTDNNEKIIQALS